MEKLLTKAPPYFWTLRGSLRPGICVPELRRRTIDFVIAMLVVAGLINSWASGVILVENSSIAVNAAGEFQLIEVKTPIFYATHGLAVATIMSAALLCVLSGRFRVLSAWSAAALYALTVAVSIWAAVSYKWNEIFSTEIFGATGPFVWWSVLLILAGVDRQIWKYLEPVIRMLAYASTALAIRAVAATDYAYFRGYSSYIHYASLLTWLGGWTLLTATRMRGWRLMLRGVPALALLVSGIYSQSRSWTILGCLLGILFLLLRAKERHSLIEGIRSLVVCCCLCAVAGFSLYVLTPQKLTRAVEGLNERLADDTRSKQYIEFFNSVPPTDLLLGRGPKGTWYWPGIGQYRYFDNGYLWTLFEGGVPFLVCYFVVVIWPAIRALFRKPQGGDAAAVFLVLFWGLALTGLSTYVMPSIQITSFVVYLYAGRCHRVIAERRGEAYARAASRYLQGRWRLQPWQAPIRSL